MTRRFGSLDEVRASVGLRVGPGAWHVVDQPSVDGFADLTRDHEWIHVDVDRARRSDLGGTIAHGFLTLALIPWLGRSVYTIDAPGQLLNYGMERARFPHPTPVGARIRSWVTPVSVSPHDRGHLITLEHTIEIEHQVRPACVARTVFLLAASIGERD